MDIPKLHDHTLWGLHALVLDAQKADDGLPPGQKRYGVREYADWQQLANDYEDEMSKRGLPFTRIDWNPAVYDVH
jgi:hypothetical protein